MSCIEYVQKRSGAVVPFTPDRITNAIYRAAVAVGGRDKETAQNLSTQVVAILEEQCKDGHTPHVEEIQDIVEKVLIEYGHATVAKAYILYRDEQARKRKEQAKASSIPAENVPWAKVWQVLDWAIDHDVHTVSSLNRRIAAGEFAQIVSESEKAYEEDVDGAADLMLERSSDLKIVIITGPSSSGKTTTTIKIGERLKRKKLKLVTLNVDNYFFDLEMHPKDEFGDYDFETPQALDMKLVNEHINKLLNGEEIMVPFYDFKTGRRTGEVTPMRIAKNEIILIDSLHGLYGEMTKDIPAEKQFRLYLEPLMQMKDDSGHYVRWTDIRLMRRMLRDAAHRAYDTTQTLLHWHYVRSSEMRNIIPYIHTTDYIINSAMPYELPLYAQRLLPDFKRWVKEYKGDPLRLDAYTRAERLDTLLSTITPVSDDIAVPSNSVLREFIGGSSLKY